MRTKRTRMRHPVVCSSRHEAIAKQTGTCPELSEWPAHRSERIGPRAEKSQSSIAPQPAGSRGTADSQCAVPDAEDGIRIGQLEKPAAERIKSEFDAAFR